jgi:uncharacterized phage protein (TIGR01671 family)
MTTPNRFRFRAWDRLLKRMFRDTEIGDSCAAGTTLADLFHNVDPSRVVWMQSTGLADLQGVEIFEGDICTVRDNGWEDTAVIRWDQKRGCLRACRCQSTYRGEVNTVLKVCGNVYG